MTWQQQQQQLRHKNGKRKVWVAHASIKGNNSIKRNDDKFEAIVCILNGNHYDLPFAVATFYQIFPPSSSSNMEHGTQFKRWYKIDIRYVRALFPRLAQVLLSNERKDFNSIIHIERPASSTHWTVNTEYTNSAESCASVCVCVCVRSFSLLQFPFDSINIMKL